MPDQSSQAFFSYSREDSEFALLLAKDLKAAGAIVWLDQLDISPGQRWDRAVEDALLRCSRMLVVLSPSSIASNNVMDEVSYALEEQKTVIPVLRRDCAVPFRLRRVQYIDFRGDYDTAVRTLLKTLAVEGPPQRAQTAPGGTPVEQSADARKSEAEQKRRERGAEATRKTEQERQERKSAEKESRPPKAGASAQEPDQKSHESEAVQAALSRSRRKYWVAGSIGLIALALGIWYGFGRHTSTVPQIDAPPPSTYQFGLLRYQAQYLRCAYVTSDFFHVARAPILRGRGFNDSDYASGSRKVVVISQEFAKRTFGTQDSLQYTLDLDGQAFVIVGVVGLYNWQGVEICLPGPSATIKTDPGAGRH
jgi:hypothetical protein